MAVGDTYYKSTLTTLCSHLWCSLTLCSNFRSTFGPADVLTDSVLFCIAESEFLAKNKNLTLSSPNLRENWEKSSFLRFFESKIEGNIFCQSVFLMKVSITIMIYKKVERTWKLNIWRSFKVSKCSSFRFFKQFYFWKYIFF